MPEKGERRLKRDRAGKDRVRHPPSYCLRCLLKRSLFLRTTPFLLNARATKLDFTSTVPFRSLTPTFRVGETKPDESKSCSFCLLCFPYFRPASPFLFMHSSRRCHRRTTRELVTPTSLPLTWMKTSTTWEGSNFEGIVK
ncbi:hypothetical protein AAZX31_02G106200 [Glycine max]